MAEVMLGKELHPDRVIPVEKLYEILNEYEINYSFPAQCEIENNAFAVVRCKDCKHRKEWLNGGTFYCQNPDFGMASGVELQDNDFCSYGERRTDE